MSGEGDRLETGIAGLDTILGGGVFEGGIYIIQGAPGAGKTILGPVSLAAGVTVVRAQHNGTGNFIVTLFLPNPAETPQQSVDDASYTNRFTPRRAGSNWSLVNIKRVGELIALGRMQPRGLHLFEQREIHD